MEGVKTSASQSEASNRRPSQFKTFDTEIERLPVPEIPPDWDKIKNPAKGIRSQTYSYFRNDEVSSSAQKAVRRGYSLGAIQWFLELFWTGKASQTNIWNRALVMSVEDIGPANIYAFSQIYQLAKNSKNEPKALVMTAIILAQSKKSRVNDWGFHAMEPYADKLVRISWPEQLKDMLRKAMAARDAEHLTVAITAAIALTRVTVKITKIRGYRKFDNPQIMIWEVFDLFFRVDTDVEFTYRGHIKTKTESKFNQYYLMLKDLAFSTGWRWKGKSFLLFMHIIHLWFTGGTKISHEQSSGTDCDPEDVPCKMGGFPTDEDLVKYGYPKLDPSLQGYVDFMFQRKYQIGVPDYALDKHTRRGKSSGRGLQHFIEVAGQINDEDANWKPLSDWYLSLIKGKPSEVQLESAEEEHS